MKVITYRKFFLVFSALVMAVSLFAIIYDGLTLSIDFTGGSLMEVRYPAEDNASDIDEARPLIARVRGALDKLQLGGYQLQPIAEDGYLVRTRSLSESERATVFNAFSMDGVYEPAQERFTSIGPSVGAELARKALIALVLVSLAIVLFVAYAFRKVSDPVSSWKYGMVAIVTLIHDILVPSGVFAVLGIAAGVEIDILFVTALLAILGYSVNDTIVVFDRIRENLSRNKENRTHESFAETVGKSLQQTYMRSVNTSLTTALVLAALLFFGGESTRYFSLALLIGVVAGTYSSIFFASPLLVAVAGRGADDTTK